MNESQEVRIGEGAEISIIIQFLEEYKHYISVPPMLGHMFPLPLFVLV